MVYFNTFFAFCPLLFCMYLFKKSFLSLLHKIRHLFLCNVTAAVNYNLFRYNAICRAEIPARHIFLSLILYQIISFRHIHIFSTHRACLQNLPPRHQRKQRLYHFGFLAKYPLHISALSDRLLLHFCSLFLIFP